MAVQFKLPELGENITSGNVTKILVAVGETVAVDQPIIEIETDKAVLEVPSSVSGTVAEVRAKEGAEINVGDVVLVVSDDGAASAEPAPPSVVEEKVEAPAPPPKPAPEPVESTPPAAVEAQTEEPAPAEPVTEPAPAARRREGGPVPASPSVRRLAREIGVDVNEVGGSGPAGRISMDDVKGFARQINVDVRGISTRARVASMPLPDFSRWGDIERQPMSGVRRRTAENMAHAWASVPHVTQFDKADVTELEKLRKQFGKRVEGSGGKLTVTAIVVKVLGSALQKFPQFNATVDMDNAEIVYKKYYNIGVAVDTDRGLIVPVIKNVDQKNVTQIAVELAQIAERARNRKVTLEQMQGGTFTVSNLGGIGGTNFTPIVNAPEVAVLGIARSRVEPVYDNGNFVPRTLLPVAVSYDHRVIDGADGARFIRWIVEVLEQPFIMFLEGAGGEIPEG
jgi:pyruvate dehydrogenase E2 component (dihydrolipoyllysine-residue acetyltransferase)